VEGEGKRKGKKCRRFFGSIQGYDSQLCSGVWNIATCYLCSSNNSL